MNKTKILILGKKSFIGSSLYFYFKKNHDVKIKNYESKFLKNLGNFDFIINCCNNKNYLENKYSKKNDFDLQIAKKIKNEKTHLLLLSTRKIYNPGPNLKENSEIKCTNHYEKNKYITEKAILKIKKKNLTILRISNLIGFKFKKNRRLHFTYLDEFLSMISMGKIIDNQGIYKDFLDIKTFSKIVNQIIKKDIQGIFNVSIGKKVYLNEFNSWLLRYYKDKKSLKKVIIYPKKQSESFYLNNSKLKKKINLKISIQDLKKECFKLSKKLFN